MASGEQNITALPVKTNTGVANSDYFMGIDSAEGYQILIRDVAKYIMENYNGSTLARQAQTPKAAIDALNSNKWSLTGGTALAENTNIDTIFTPGNYGTSSSGTARTMSGLPTTGNDRYAFNLKVENSAFNDTYARRQTLQYFNDTFKYVRYGTVSNNSWNNWVKEPTRAEVDALNSSQTYNSGQTIYIGGNNAMYAGRIGWGGLEIWFNVPIDKPIASNVTTATLTLNGNIYACSGTQAVQINNKISEAICYIGAGGRNFLSIRFNLSSNPLTVSDAGLNVMLSSTLSEVALS